MEELLREMALSMCLQNTTDTTTTPVMMMSDWNRSCDEVETEVIGWIYATDLDVLRHPAVAALVVLLYAVVIVLFITTITSASANS